MHNLSTTSLDFSPDGRTMVTSGYDGSVRLWDFSNPADPRLFRSSLVPPDSTGWMLRFHPGGDYLIGASKDGRRRLWDLNEQRVIDRICTITGTLMTPDLWERHLPFLPYRPPCG
ncbi:WD40 repeat domain-containing protein [Nocardia sp. NPDC055321]